MLDERFAWCPRCGKSVAYGSLPEHAPEPQTLEESAVLEAAEHGNGATGGRLDRSTLETIVHIEEVGNGDLVVDTVDGTRLRVSAIRHASSRRFLASYEALSVRSWQGRDLLVWEPTTSYRIATAFTVEDCLDSALAAIEAGPQAPGRGGDMRR
jgi:hypothetical protein